MAGRPRFSAPKFATEESLLDLMNRKFHTSFPSAYSAATWLDQNGYWKSFTITTTTTTVYQYTVGESALGGKIAYILTASDPGYDAGVQHGLVAKTTDISTGAEWGCYTTSISGADGTAIGTGNQNTHDIVAGCATAGIAARLCNDSSEGSYNDWYLPSKNELNKLYLNKTAIGGFAAADYWSSSEGSGVAWRQYFGNGNQYVSSKLNNRRVRSVRSF